jgi:peptidoglycan hydrolase-like protein with peptidoglycan-binding domain
MFMRGKSVRMLQELLQKMGYPIDDQPGIFGPSTRDAVKNFQTQQGLKATGMVDDELLKLIRQGHAITEKPENAGSKVAPAPQPVNQDQLDALIRLMIRKGIISEDELQAEMKRIPAKKAAILPLS